MLRRYCGKAFAVIWASGCSGDMVCSKMRVSLVTTLIPSEFHGRRERPEHCQYWGPSFLIELRNKVPKLLLTFWLQIPCIPRPSFYPLLGPKYPILGAIYPS